MLLSNTLNQYAPTLDSELSRERFPPLYLLVLETDHRSRSFLQKLARDCKFIVSEAQDVPTARTIMKRQAVDLLMLDPTLRSDRRESFFEEVKALHPETNIIAFTAVEGLSLAIDAVKNGAIDYFTKPLARENVTSVLDRSRQQLYATIRSRRLRERFRAQKGSGHLIGHSKCMGQLRESVARVANSRNPVLVRGEAGVGKELVARTIHFQSKRAAGPFLLSDCRALSQSLRGSELFGHVKNAFPGAHDEQRGLLELAANGTIVLDGVSELSMDVQAELVRVLRDGEVRSVGSHNFQRISARVIATASRDIAMLVERGRFRRDLYSLLNVINIRVPSLRDRFEDIQDLAIHFIDRINRHSRMRRTLSDDSMALLQQYSWPGNVRELENAVEYACFHSPDDTVRPRDFPVSIHASRSRPDQVVSSLAPKLSKTSPSLLAGRSIGEIEKEAILSTLDYTNGDKRKAAELLHLGKTTLYRKLKEYGVVENGH